MRNFNDSCHESYVFTPRHCFYFEVFLNFEKKNLKQKLGIRNIGLVAGGSGITPMLQIVRDVFKSQEDTRLWLLFANQTEEDILLREEIEDIQRQYPNRFSFMYTLDRPNDSWIYQKGFINKG